MKLTLVLLLAVACSASFEVQNEPMTLCGNQLAKAIFLVCSSTENSKRDAGWRLPGNVVRVLNGVRGKRGGVADECCIKPCYLEEILTFC
ncbi:hypothetical protein PYW08_014397 [Mythimna loreyi]|uniref:Uncharacterized protein n=1 Tax=Mythimna loreyi TaxID=667449 RepID=A0ACC2R7F6_9NEOP|nr:hypothetical protein PYW08_014397 [Mythimna loreyi]